MLFSQFESIRKALASRTQEKAQPSPAYLSHFKPWPLQLNLGSIAYLKAQASMSLNLHDLSKLLHNLLKLCVILKRWPCVVFLHKSLNLSPSQFAPAPCLSPSGIPSRHGHQGHRRCHPHPETFKGGGRKDADRQSPRVWNVVVVVGGHEALDVGRRRHRPVKKRRWWQKVGHRETIFDSCETF